MLPYYNFAEHLFCSSDTYFFTKYSKCVANINALAGLVEYKHHREVGCCEKYRSSICDSRTIFELPENYRKRNSTDKKESNTLLLTDEEVSKVSNSRR